MINAAAPVSLLKYTAKFYLLKTPYALTKMLNKNTQIFPVFNGTPGVYNKCSRPSQHDPTEAGTPKRAEKLCFIRP